MKKTILISAVVLGLVVAGAGSLKWKHREGKRLPQRHPLADQSRPWYGGKPSAPVTVTSDIDGPIPANEDRTVNLGIQIDTPCVEAKVQVRGVDGVVVVSGQQPVSLGACREGEEVPHQVVIRIPSGLAGLLVIELSFEGLGDGSAPGERQGFVTAISIVAEGAKIRLKSLGKPSRDGTGGVELGNSKNVR